MCLTPGCHCWLAQQCRVLGATADLSAVKCECTKRMQRTVEPISRQRCVSRTTRTTSATRSILGPAFVHSKGSVGKSSARCILASPRRNCASRARSVSHSHTSRVQALSSQFLCWQPLLWQAVVATTLCDAQHDPCWQSSFAAVVLPQRQSLHWQASQLHDSPLQSAHMHPLFRSLVSS